MNIRLALEAYRRLVRAPRIAVLCDFDGTLAPIVDHPDHAEIVPASREALHLLSIRGDADVAVISGRPLSDLVDRVGLSRINYSGCSGLELHVDGRRIEPPDADAIRARMARVADVLDAEFQETPVMVERKGLSVAVHWRAAPEAGLMARTRIQELTKDFGVKLTPGKMVMEIGPEGEGGKAFAVREILENLRKKERVTLYIGDDIVDEEAFEYVRSQGGVTVLVGERKDTHAEHRLGSPDAVAQFLMSLAEIRAPYPEGG